MQRTLQENARKENWMLRTITLKKMNIAFLPNSRN
jgi:hypothetical protein